MRDRRLPRQQQHHNVQPSKFQLAARPWDEAWNAAGNNIQIIITDGVDDRTTMTVPRARLAARAPDMARLLIEYARLDLGCLDCEGTESHADDCELWPILLQCGVK